MNEDWSEMERLTLTFSETIVPKLLRSITSVPCQCLVCGWDGITGNCEADDDGDLICPECRVRVTIHYAPHEIAPVAVTEPSLPSSFWDGVVAALCWTAALAMIVAKLMGWV